MWYNIKAVSSWMGRFYISLEAVFSVTQNEMDQEIKSLTSRIKVIYRCKHDEIFMIDGFALFEYLIACLLGKPHYVHPS